MRTELVALRQAMAEAKIDAYIIPTDDFHGSEYVGAYFKCRMYVSGFTGSAGTLVVTQDWAGLWTDGRYFLQASQQLAGTGIDLMKMGEPGVPTLQEWVSENLQSGQVLGFDGRTMTSGTGKAYAELAEKKGASLCYDKDLAGDIWPDRPPMSEKPVWGLTVEEAGCSRREKLADLRKAIAEAGADVHLLTGLDDLAWLLNIRGDDVDCCPVVLCDLILTQDSCVFYVNEKKFSPALLAELEADGIEFRPYLQLYTDVPKLPSGSKILLDPTKVNYALLSSIPADAELIEKSNPTTAVKAVKNPTEVENEKLAHIRDGAALTHFMKWIKDHVGKEEITEISASQRLEQFRQEQEDYIGPSFYPIMGYAHHGAIIHYGATPESDIPLKAEGLLLADTGGHYRQGSTDVTRTFVLGPLTEEMKYHYTLVLRSHLALLGATFKKGCSGVSVDILARKPFWDAGLDYNHGTGHGVGYLLPIHEGPQRIHYSVPETGSAPAMLKPGMITSDEPGIYLEGKYGVRLENLTVCVERFTNDYGTFYGFDALTMCPFELDAIEPQQMTVEEIRLLNAYHAQVLAALTPYFEGEELTWLQNACRAI